MAKRQLFRGTTGPAKGTVKETLYAAAEDDPDKA
jgi:hypothetical protein